MGKLDYAPPRRVRLPRRVKAALIVLLIAACVVVADRQWVLRGKIREAYDGWRWHRWLTRTIDRFGGEPFVVIDASPETVEGRLAIPGYQLWRWPPVPAYAYRAAMCVAPIEESSQLPLTPPFGSIYQQAGLRLSGAVLCFAPVRVGNEDLVLCATADRVGPLLDGSAYLLTRGTWKEGPRIVASSRLTLELSSSPRPVRVWSVPSTGGPTDRASFSVELDGEMLRVELQASADGVRVVSPAVDSFRRLPFAGPAEVKLDVPVTELPIHRPALVDDWVRSPVMIGPRHFRVLYRRPIDLREDQGVIRADELKTAGQPVLAEGWSTALSPRGTYCVEVSQPNFQLHRWRLRRSEVPGDVVLSEDGPSLRRVAYAPDESAVAISTSGTRWATRIFNLPGGDERCKLDAPEAIPDGLVFSADGKAVISVIGSNIHKFDATTGRELGRRQLHAGPGSGTPWFAWGDLVFEVRHHMSAFNVASLDWDPALSVLSGYDAGEDIVVTTDGVLFASDARTVAVVPLANGPARARPRRWLLAPPRYRYDSHIDGLAQDGTYLYALERNRAWRWLLADIRAAQRKAEAGRD
jgi:hypothetical protein